MLKLFTYAFLLVIHIWLFKKFNSPHVWNSLSKVSYLVVFGPSTLPGVRMEAPCVISADTMARKQLKCYNSRGGWLEIWGTEATCDLARLRTRGSTSYYPSVVQFSRKTQLQPFVSNVSLLYQSCHLCTIVYCGPPILSFRCSRPERVLYLSDALWCCPPSPSPFWAFIQHVNSCPIKHSLSTGSSPPPHPPIFSSCYR